VPRSTFDASRDLVGSRRSTLDAASDHRQHQMPPSAQVRGPAMVTVRIRKWRLP
jgi:hypothetical protein